jgi:hypothetical protein
MGIPASRDWAQQDCVPTQVRRVLLTTFLFPRLGLGSMLPSMLSRPIPGSSGEILTTLPSAYLPHAATGLLHLPRFIAKIKYVKAHGALPASYAKNYKRGMDRFLSLHLGVDPSAVEKIVLEAADDAEIDAKLQQLFPADLRAAKWNRDYVQKGMTPSGREFLKEALTNMGCADRVEQIVSVVDLIEFDEGRIE